MSQCIPWTPVWTPYTPALAGQTATGFSPQAPGNTESRPKILEEIRAGHVITTPPGHE